MRSVLLELRLKKLIFVIRYRFLIQDEDVRYVIVMDLQTTLISLVYVEVLKKIQPFP